MDCKKIRVLFLHSGNGSLFQVAINFYNAGLLPIELLGVVTDRACFALQRGKNFCSFAKLINYSDYATNDSFQEALLETLKELNPDLIFTLFNRILSEKIVNFFSDRIVNLHPSLLPAFTGFRAVKKAFESGVRYVGATLHFVDSGVDTGAPIMQCVLPVLPFDTERTLNHRLFPFQIRMMLQVLKWFGEGKVIKKDRSVIVLGADYSGLPFSPSIEDFRTIPDLAWEHITLYDDLCELT